MKTVKEPNTVQGEGDYKAAQRYDKSVQSFVKSGKVAQAVQKAGTVTPQETHELEKAERAGLSHSKGEDPGVKSKAHRKP